MSEKIEPALSAEEWKRFRERFQMYDDMGTPDMYKFEGYFGAQGVAVHNATLDGSDPRKITREKIDGLRSILDRYAASLGPSPVDHEEIRDTSRAEGIQSARRFLKALESFLPPEK